ncbi:Cytochrome c lysine N-methyltransferase 1 [Candida viswanathii]|uniref:Cytochrome c lysine N-methyltransferase 1 n=1 Tax=Candida viswanathii TaxID=5486 RepID=A0A367YJN6_9ASCO|nr:Cytochrome c lysine N-methyltransferase 1 [Candida viswanathii]
MTQEDTIIPPDLKIPGVANNTELLHWIKDQKIIFHPNLSIEESKLGGIGLFFTPPALSELPESDFEILRIPRGSSFCLDTLIKPLEEIKLRDSAVFPGTVPIKESDLVVNFLNSMEPTSETHIILTYFFAFKTAQNLRLKYPKSSYYAKSPLRKLDTYLDILCNTFTIKYPEHSDENDDFIMSYMEMSQKFRLEYESVVEQLRILHRDDDCDVDFTELFPFDQCYQIYQAVRSRILEIPRSIRESEIEEIANDIENNLADLSISLDANAKKIVPVRTNEDFVIDISLVPILDFANHAHKNNAFFDIDRDSDSIILKLKRQDVAKEKFEVTISYNPEDNIKDFMFTYGFQPQIVQSGHYQLFELKLRNLDKYIPQGSLLCKWLKILPQIQFAFNDHEVYLNFFSNNLPLLFIDGISYNKDWLDLLLPHFIKFNDIPEGYDTKINGEELTNLYLYQEKEYDYINGVDPIGVKYKDTTLPNLSSILEVTESDFDELISKTIEFIANVYCRDKIKAIAQLQVKNNFDELINNYHNFQIDLFKRLIDKYEKDPKSVILPDDIAKMEWEVEYRSKPRELTLDDDDDDDEQ